MTFEVKLLIHFVATYSLVILIKCRKNPIKHEGVTFSVKNDIFDPCDPYMTFEVKQSITFVATYQLVILTKFGRNPIKHVEEDANCEKERKKSQERNKLGEPPNLNKNANYICQCEMVA